MIMIPLKIFPSRGGQTLLLELLHGGSAWNFFGQLPALQVKAQCSVYHILLALSRIQSLLNSSYYGGSIEMDDRVEQKRQ